MTGHRPFREISERRRSGAAGPHGPKSPDRANNERKAVEQEEKDEGTDMKAACGSEHPHGPHSYPPAYDPANPHPIITGRAFCRGAGDQAKSLEDLLHQDAAGFREEIKDLDEESFKDRVMKRIHEETSDG